MDEAVAFKAIFSTFEGDVWREREGGGGGGELSNWESCIGDRVEGAEKKKEKTYKQKLDL